MANERKEITGAEKGKEAQRAAAARALSPFEEMERMFEGFFPRGWMRPWRFEWPAWPELAEARLPSVDVIDRDDEVLVRAELPGVDKKDLDVSMTEDTVTIKGTTQREEKEEKGDYYRHEIARGAFARTVTLPAEVDGTRAKAAFKDGVLELVLPKREKAKRHSIKVE
jgi:HSP20 family protein